MNLCRLMTTRRLLALGLFGPAALASSLSPSQAHAQAGSQDQASNATQPNVVVINIDDMGWGDFQSYGNQFTSTPNIDSLASSGVRFTQFYASAPICSPSRTGLLTGQFPARNRINTYIDGTGPNARRDTANHLSLDAPTMSAMFHDSGYTTGHFGKWHMGGGRDVGYEVNPTPGTNASAPRIVEYGFDEAWTQFEGLGNRIITVQDYGGNADGTTTRPSDYYNGYLNSSSDARGTGGGLDQLVYIEREHNAEFMVNRAMDFIDDRQANKADQPFFMNVWFDEVHTPHDPPPALQQKYRSMYPNMPQQSINYLAVLEQTDTQVGRLIEHIDQAGLGEDTVILITSDNGPEPNNANAINSNGGLRGIKGQLYEGGFRQPLIVRWTGHVEGGLVNDTTVMAMTDLVPSLASVAGVNPPDANLDGEDLSAALLGNTQVTRQGDLFWNSNRGDENRHPNGGAEAVALRRGDWKIIANSDGENVQLFNLAADPTESHNLAEQKPQLASQLVQAAVNTRYEMPALIHPNTSSPIGHLRALDVDLQDGEKVQAIADTATGDGFDMNVLQTGNADARPTYRSNVLNGQPVFDFDGNDVLVSTDRLFLPDASKGLTFIAVVSGDQSGGTAKRLAQLGDIRGEPGQVVGLDVSTSGKNVGNGGAGFRFNNGAALHETPLEGSDDDFHIVIWQIGQGDNYEDAVLYVDGTAEENTFTGLANADRVVDLLGDDLQFTLGTGILNGSLSGNDYFRGQLAEMLVYNETMDIGDLNLVANYLSTTYDLPFAYNTEFMLVPEPVSASVLSLVGGSVLMRRPHADRSATLVADDQALPTHPPVVVSN